MTYKLTIERESTTKRCSRFMEYGPSWCQWLIAWPQSGVMWTRHMYCTYNIDPESVSTGTETLYQLRYENSTEGQLPGRTATPHDRRTIHIAGNYNLYIHIVWVLYCNYVYVLLYFWYIILCWVPIISAPYFSCSLQRFYTLFKKWLRNRYGAYKPSGVSRAFAPDAG